MSIIQLTGLPGLNRLNPYAKKALYERFSSELKPYENDPDAYEYAAEVLYDNQLFKNKFGEDVFKQVRDAGYDLSQRNEMLHAQVVNDKVDELYKPNVVNGNFDLSTGAGKDWERIRELSIEGKEKLLNSGWFTPNEFNSAFENSSAAKVGKTISWTTTPLLEMAKLIPGVGKIAGAFDQKDFANETVLEHARGKNAKVLDTIYGEDADIDAANQSKNVSIAYKTPEIVGANDEETKQKFYEAITPNKATGNLGIPEYASHWGDGSDIAGDMESFSIDDMRDVLAKKYVYDRTMSPLKAMTALNNEAKRYLVEHQSGLRNFGLFNKDVFISTLSYTADKINSLYNLWLFAEDKWDDYTGNEKPLVYVDSQTHDIIDPNKESIQSDEDGNMFYRGEDGKVHYVHQEEFDRRTLHNLGKNFDGSDAEEGIFHLNPVYWTRAEQFNTLDADEQKQWERIGSSPYKVVYNPNDDRDLTYEAFKMASFGIADTASMLIPFGVGATGRVLSAASKGSKIVSGLGKGLNFIGRGLTYETKAGQLIQGTAAAGGIAYAYQRGTFQESLAQNLSNVEEANLDFSRQEIDERYNNDAEFRANVNKEINYTADQLKQQFIENNPGQEIPNNDYFVNIAREQVNKELVSNRAEENKKTQRYATLQQQAIQAAGDAAWLSFWPEAIKYSLVNRFGYRKFLYTNPQGVAKKVSSALKGLKEVEVAGKDGVRRLATTGDLSSKGSKALKFGKVILSQAWGGAWTNGTDDMMVDAAERVSNDSFNRYLDAYKNGESLAVECGLIDGLYSYWRGLGNSLGQETTWEAAAVGAGGSLVSAAPNMANIAHLATKEGRDAYRSNFQNKLVYDVDENGYRALKTDKDGKPITEKVSWKDNWRERLGFFVQNGVLNTYYGAKQNARELQHHADYINAILDKYDDFSSLKGLIASDIERQNVKTLRDEKTTRFIQAFESISALKQLAKSKDESTKLSSSIDEAMAIIEGASKLGMDDSTLSEQQISQLLSEYYANNPEVGESDTNHEIALSHIAKNAQKMMEAYRAFNDTGEWITNYEKDRGVTIAPNVKFRMMLSNALVRHWEERLGKMKEEIGDTSEGTEPTGETLIATYGGVANAKRRLKEYDNGAIVMTADGLVIRESGEKKLTNDLNKAIANVAKKLEAYNKSVQTLRNAETSEAKYDAEQTIKQARTEYENAVAERDFIQDDLTTLQEKKRRLSEAIEEHETSGTKESKVLTADEIMALDPISRARMLDTIERVGYSKAQIRQLNKLESELKDRDKSGDPLQKVQDIALLIQNISQAKDAFNRMSNNPDAAALQMEKQTVQEAENAYKLINERNAYTLSTAIYGIVDGLKVNKVSEKDINNVVYRMLRKHNSTLLDIVDSEELLPEYQEQIADAKAWSKVLSDIDAVVSQSNQTPEQKEEIGKVIDSIVEPANNKEEIISRLEQAIDSNHSQAEVFDKLLSGMTNLGYTRNSVVLEKRKERKEREEAAKVKAEEEAKKRAEEAAKAAAEEAARKAEEDARAMEEGKYTTADEEKQKGIEGDMDVDLGVVGEEGEVAGKTDTKGEDAVVVPQPTEQEVNGKSLDEYLDIIKPLPSEELNGGLDYRTASRIRDEIKAGTNHTRTEYDNLSEEELRRRLDHEINRIEEGRKWLAERHKESEGELSWDALRGPLTKIEIASKNAQQYLSALYKKQQNPESSVIDNMKTGHDDTIGDYVEGHSPTVAEEMQQAKEVTDDVVVTNETTDSDIINDNVEKANETEPTTLSGNAMAEYDSTALREHRLEHKKGEKADDSMNQYYDWMRNAGVKLQNIIDDELPKILAANPHAKIKFMRTRPTPNATHDEALKNTMLLVIDYDNSINKGIISIHNEDNGGVVDSDGKKYLIVGTLGFGDSGLQSERGKLWQSLNTAKVGHSLPTVAWQWFKQPGHEAERFYVHDGFYTEQVPGSMIPGWIIRENETDGYPQSRRISELIADKERNPHGLNFNNLAWSIIEYTQSVDINTKGREVMHPRNQDANAGRVFVLIPAGNGKLLAAKIDALYLNDEKFNRESALYQELQQLFTQLVAPQYKDRYDALVQLFQKLYMTEDGHNILLDPNANAITFKRAGNKMRTIYTKAPNFDIQELYDAIAEWNPRINITAKVLSSPKELQKYDEAGALMTDLAKLGTAGVNYSVYAIDSDGNMIKLAEVDPKINRAASDSEYRDTRRLDVPYLYGELYHYDIDAGTYTKDGVIITDAETIKGLNYARRIVGMSPAKTEGVWDYYVLSEGEKAEVIKQSNKTKKIEEVQGEEAQRLIQEIEEQKTAAAREAAIQAKLEEDSKDTSSTVVDEETGEITVVEQEESKESKSNDVEAFKEAIIEATIKFYKDNNIELRPESINGMKQTSASQIMLNPNVANIRDMQAIQDVLKRFEKPVASVKPASTQEGTQNFSQAVRNKTSRTKIIDAINDKISKDSTWSDTPMKSPRQLEEYLRNKGVQLDIIPTDEAGLDAWIHNNIVCK